VFLEFRDACGTLCISAGKHERRDEQPDLEGSSALTSVPAGYCGGEHQTLDWSTHKVVCIQVKKSGTSVEPEEKRFNSLPSSLLFKTRSFEAWVRHFWGILETHTYMQARLGW
jgi:hypothetical protein